MNRKTMNRIIVGIVSVLLLLTPTIASSQELLTNDKSLSHRIVPYHEEVEVGNNAKFELTVSNTHNPDAKESTLTILLPQLVNDGSVVFVSDVTNLSIYGVTPTLQNNMLVYNFPVIEEGFVESVVLDFYTINGLAVNDQALSIASTLEQGSVVEVDDARVLLKSSWNLTTTNEYLGTKETVDGALEESENLILGDYAVYGVGALVEKLASGTLALNHNEPVILRYTVPKGAVYVSNTLGVEPVVESTDSENTVLLWTLDSASFETDSDYFAVNFQITLEVEDPNYTLENYERYETTFTADANFLDLQTYSSTAHSTSMVTKKDGSVPTPTYGSRYLPGFGGPSDAKGNTGSIGVNNDISVTDSAELGWTLFTTPQSATHPYTALEGYDVFFAPSDKQRIESLYTGDYFYRPNTSEGRKELLEDVYMSFSVLYKNENTWTNLVETLNQSTTYTAQELGIDSTKDIDLVWLAFHTNKPEDVKFPNQIGTSLEGNYERGKIPAGLTSGSIKFKTSITDGYTGDVSGRFGQAISGFNVQDSKINQHTLTLSEFIDSGRLSAHSNMGLGPNLEGYIPPMTAKVVAPTDGDSRVIQAEVKFEDALSGVVESGSNRIKVSVKSDELSLRTIKGPFDIQMLLPEGVSFDDSKDLEGGVFKNIVKNYNGTSRDLLTLTFKGNQTLPAGRIISMFVPVNVGENSPYELETIVTGALLDDFVVSDNANDIGYITQKVSDPFDESGNPKEVYMIKNITSYKFAYSHYIVASALDSKTNTFKQNVKIDEGEEIVSKLTLINNLETNTMAIDVVYTLPHINDTFMLNNAERFSTVDLQLSEFVDATTLSMFDVYYTYDDEISENTVWLSEDEVSDLSLVKSLRITKRSDTAGIKDKEVSFEIKMNPFNQEKFNEVADIQAVQTFTAKIDDNETIESAPSYITSKKEDVIPEEPEEPKDPTEPKEPEEEKPKDPNTGLEGTSSYVVSLYVLIILGGVSYIFNQLKRKNVNS